jgi:hypothetical protein
MWVAAERRTQETDECLSAPQIRLRAQRARAAAEATLAEFERLELEWAASEALLQGACAATARLERANELACTRHQRLRLAFCDAVLAGA